MHYLNCDAKNEAERRREHPTEGGASGEGGAEQEERGWREPEGVGRTTSPECGWSCGWRCGVVDGV